MLNDQQAHDFLHAAGDELVVEAVDATAVISGSRRRRTRLVLTVVGVAVAVSLVAGGFALGFGSGKAGGPTAQTSTHSTGQPRVDAETEHRLWLIASQAARSLGGQIKIAEAVRSQHARAVRVTSGGRVTGNQAVWVIQVEGVRQFVCGLCSGPPGASAPRGRFVTIVLDATTFDRTDFGIAPERVDLARLGTVIRLHE
jgi:hypothetical protein